eukprot:TRINITY_DN17076_c1_g1_i1.p1 TRINITY_DN17076_c1_g1~~TRINITY_DN17076_c1_g1_i1.p1  ORF type:complete len:398 (+),score=92.94 TRINITY_DN17076_c1_g1_i1:41-1195(+)
MPRRLALLLYTLAAVAAVMEDEGNTGMVEGPKWEKPKAPRPKPFRMGKAKIRKPGPIKEPKVDPPAKLFPSGEGRKRANSISWVNNLLNDTATLVYSARRLKNGCRMTRRDWRRKQSAAMSESPLNLPFRAVNGTDAMVTLPIEKMGKLKTYNRTVFRAYVDDDAWKAEKWHFFDLGARFFLKSGRNNVNYGSTFQFMCSYPGAEKFTYHAFDINDLSDGYPKFIKWKTGAVWNESGMLQMKGLLGAGSHVVTKDEKEEEGSGSDSSGSGSESGSGSGEPTTLVKAIDFSSYLKATVRPEDFVVIKMDIENAEFRVLEKMFETSTINLVDEMFIECHGDLTKEAYDLAGIKHGVWIPEAWVRSVACRQIEKRLRKHGIFLHEWD